MKTITTKHELQVLCSSPKTLYMSTTESGEAIHHHFIEYNVELQTFELARYSQDYCDPKNEEYRTSSPCIIEDVIRYIQSNDSDRFRIDAKALLSS